jgi:HD-GYP domain-containing protein (c-di-GMP phosphodiesterase class II)
VSIRRKLLLVLLTIALVPALVLGLMGQHGTESLGLDLARRSRELLRDQALDYLRRKTADFGIQVRSHRQLLELAVRVQAQAIERAISEASPTDATQVGEPAALLEAGQVPTVDEPAYFRRLADGSVQPQPISREHATWYRPPPDPAGPPPPGRLAALEAAYREVLAVHHRVIHWQHTTFEDGLHHVYPGRGGYPAGYDPRRTEWYRRAMREDGPVWSFPTRDPTSGRALLSVATAVHGPDGRRVGVTAIDVAAETLRVYDVPEAWARRTRVLLVTREDAAEGHGGGPRMHVFARQDYHEQGYRWEVGMGAITVEVGASVLEGLLRRVGEEGGVVVAELPYDGEPALWGVAAIDDVGDLYVVVSVPRAVVVGEAERAEGYVLAQTHRQLLLGGWVLALVVVAVSVFAFRWARHFTEPLARLSATARAIARGELHSRARIASRDEIGSLGGAVNCMADNIQHLIEEQEAAYLQMMRSLAKALETRDAYTAVHSARVTRYAVHLGHRIGLSGEQLRLLKRGALMHDLGKIGVPDAILNKPDPLAPEEAAEMRRHPEYTAAIMRPLKRFEAFSEIAAWHHERWDGMGYPDGLSGEDIPLLARIVAIADTWDAMTGDRVYRKGMAPERALAILEAEVDDGQWDPGLMRVFIAMVREELEGSPMEQALRDA